MGFLGDTQAEQAVKLAAIRKWVNAEYDNVPYVTIVHGIRAVLDWSEESQELDNEIIEAVKKANTES